MPKPAGPLWVCVNGKLIPANRAIDLSPFCSGLTRPTQAREDSTEYPGRWHGPVIYQASQINAEIAETPSMQRNHSNQGDFLRLPAYRDNRKIVSAISAPLRSLCCNRNVHRHWRSRTGFGPGCRSGIAHIFAPVTPRPGHNGPTQCAIPRPHAITLTSRPTSRCDAFFAPLRLALLCVESRRRPQHRLSTPRPQAAKVQRSQSTHPI